MTATTARKPRTRKPAATTDIVPRSPFGQQDTAAGLIWRAQVASAPATVAMDWDAFDDALASYAADEDDGREAARRQADAAHRLVNSGRDVRDRYDGHAYQAAYTGTMAGCGDEVPSREPGTVDPRHSPALASMTAGYEAHGMRFPGPGQPAEPQGIPPFREPSNVTVVPAAPLGELDPGAEEHMAAFEAAHDGQASAAVPDGTPGSGPAAAEPDAPGRVPGASPGPGAPAERQDGEAPDEAGLLPVGERKTGSGEKDGETCNG